jgi:5-methyltetrahydrofolate--homocysteine methyltransferase
MELLKENSNAKLAVDPENSWHPGQEMETRLMINNESPDRIKSFYGQTIQSGANVILTNTKYALESVLKSTGMGHLFQELNINAVRIARDIAAESYLVLGNIGSGEFPISPFGSYSFEKAVSQYLEQINILIESGVDGIYLNQFSDVQNLRAAAIAVRQTSKNIDLLVSVDNKKVKNDHQPTVETWATILNSLHVSAIGFRDLKFLRELEKYTNLPLVCIIELEDDFDKLINRLKRRRIGLMIYNCQSQKLNTLKKIAGFAKNKKIIKGDNDQEFKFTSYSKTIAAGPKLPFLKIGEKINPTGREELATELKQGNIDIIIEDAESQIKAGADALDVNVGTPMIDEKAVMVRALKQLQKRFETPLVIDSSTPEVLKAGLENYAGKALVNSIDGDEKKQDKVLPLVKKYGAAVIGLTIKGGRPGDVHERLSIARNIVEKCKSYGIPEHDIIIDTVAMAAATSPEIAIQSFETVKVIKEQLNLPAMMGISNSSFGLPKRNWVHNTFLVQAMAYGLDAGIVNVQDPELKRMIKAASIFSDRDPHCMNYIKYIRSLKAKENQE